MTNLGSFRRGFELRLLRLFDQALTTELTPHGCRVAVCISNMKFALIYDVFVS